MAASKKKTASKTRKKQSAPQKKELSLSEVIGFGIIGAAVVSFSVLISTNDPHNAIRALMDGLGGRFSMFIPFVILWVGMLITFSSTRQRNAARILQIAGGILIVYAGIHVFFAGEILSHLKLGGYLNFINQSFYERAGAGALGALLAYPVYSVAGVWGGLFILLFLGLIIAVIAFQISPRRFGERASEYVMNSYSALRQSHHDRSTERAVERAKQKKEAEERRQARDEAIRQRRSSAVSWDRVVFEGPGPTVEPIVPVGEDDVKPSEPLPRFGSFFEIPEYLKAHKRAKKPAFGDTAGEEQPETPFRKKGSRLAEPAPTHPTGYHEPDIPMKDSDYDLNTMGSFSEEAPVDPEQTSVQFEDYVFPEDEPFSAEDDAAIEYESEIIEDEYAAPVDLRAPAAEETEDSGEPDETEEESVPPASSELIYPPFDPDEPVQRERRRKTLGEPVKPAPQTSSGKYAPDDYVPNENYEPTPGWDPGMRLDHTPIVITKHKDAIPEETLEYNYPPVDLLSLPKASRETDRDIKDQEKAAKLESTLHDFGINAKLTGIAHGPAVTRFELAPAPGVKVSRITSLSDDIALSLAALSVRIEAPIPGKAAVGVEIPNETVETVPLREVLESVEARKHPSRLAVGMGKDNSGKYIVGDIAKMPHVLIAGATGSGKSVCINCIICSILYRATPEEVRLIMIDPKMVELSIYNGIPHLLVPVVTDPKKASGALQWAVAEMSDRYKKFTSRGVRDMKGYNLSCGPDEKPMPQIVIIIDELADLMMVCPGEVEDSICRLAQLARAAGIHLVIATQRPSVNIITGVIKANIPARIAFTVASFVDSRTILDVGGAEKLLGRGDMLFAPTGSNKMQRVQGAWVSDDEVHAIVSYIKERHDVEYNEDVIEHMNKAEDTTDSETDDQPSDECDELLQQAVEIVVEAGQASISMLQRRLRIGYARAGRLIDDMASRGIVSQSEGAKPRNVLITREQYLMMFNPHPNE